MIDTTPPPTANDSFFAPLAPQLGSRELRQPLPVGTQLSIGTFQTSDIACRRGFLSADGTLAIVTDAIREEATGESMCGLTIDVVQQTLSKRHVAVYTAGQLRVLINEALTVTNNAIVKAVREANGKWAGCSLVLALWTDSAVIVKSVGDCRAYLLRNNSLKQLTRDHTLSQLLAGSGQTETLLHRNQRDVLLNCLGVHDFEPNDEFATFEIRQGDRILLANAGVTSLISNSEIQTLLSQVVTATAAATTLGQTAIERGAKTTSCVVMFDV